MIKLSLYGTGLTLCAVGFLACLMGIHAFEIAGALCIERD